MFEEDPTKRDAIFDDEPPKSTFDTAHDFLAEYGKFLKTLFGNIAVDHFRGHAYQFKYYAFVKGLLGTKRVCICGIKLGKHEEKEIPIVSLGLTNEFAPNFDLHLKEFCSNFVEHTPNVQLEVEWTRMRLK